MAKILRKQAKIFASTAGANQVAQKIGNLANSDTTRTTGAAADPDTLQSLTNYLEGLFNIVIGSNSPAIEDINAIYFLFSYQLAYLLQTGVPEWLATTTYFIGSMVTSGSKIYVSLTDNNTGNAVTDTTKWGVVAGGLTTKTKTADYTMLDVDDVIFVDTNGGDVSITLQSAATATNKPRRIKNIGSGTVTLLPNGGDLIDNETTQSLSPMGVVELLPDGGTNWYVM